MSNVSKAVQTTLHQTHKQKKSFKHAKIFGVALSIYTSREGQYEIKTIVTPHNETDTGILNKNEVTFETNNRTFLQLIAIGVNLKNFIRS